MKSRSRSRDQVKKFARQQEAKEHADLKRQYNELSEAYNNYKNAEQSQSHSRSRSRSQPYGSRREVETADDSAIISVNTHLMNNPYRIDYDSNNHQSNEKNGPPRNLEPMVLALDQDESKELSILQAQRKNKNGNDYFVK